LEKGAQTFETGRYSIDPRKLTHYALDPDSPHGRHKAVLFEKLLGFTKENHTELLRQLEGGAMQSEVTFHSEDRFGKLYTADIPVEGTENRRAVVRTGWIIPPGSRDAHLATLYVRKK
jgi:filamentous hemagglutinin